MRTGIRAGVRRLFRLAVRTPAAIRRDVDEELRFQIEARTEYLIARGLSPDAARAEALRRLGTTLDEARARLHHSAERREHRMRLHQRMDDLRHDLRYAVRGLLRRPGFTAVAVLTLAVGIGANTAIFSAVDALLLRPLPFPHPEQLMKVSLIAPGSNGYPGSDDMVWSYPKFVTFRDAQTVFQDLSLYDDRTFSIMDGSAERVHGEDVGARYLSTLVVSPALGRNFLREEDAHAGARRVVILSDELWKRRYNADPAVLGRTIHIDGQPYETVGVTPPGFRGLSGQAELFIPITVQSAEDLNQAWSHQFTLVARLGDRVTPQRAHSEVARLGKVVDAAYPGRDGQSAWGATTRALNATRVAPVVRRSLLVLFGAVGFVLLIACVNLASLLLGRATTRRREIAIRLAIGAGRARLVRLLLTESVLLSLLGGAASVLVAWWGTRALSAVNPASTLRLQRLGGLGAVGFSSIHLDVRALLFTLAVALGTGVLFGLVPALQATRPSLTASLKEGGVPSPRAGTWRGITSRRLLMVVEVALALVLLAGSGLMVRSLGKLLRVDPGFDAHNVLTLRLNVPPGGIARDSLPGFYDRLLTRLGAIPGVTGAALGDCPPLNGGCNRTVITFAGRPPVPLSEAPPLGVHTVTPGWFAALHVPLLRGRLLTDADRMGLPKVVLVSQAAARRYWPNDDPIGKRVSIYQSGFQDGATVIGVVGDVRYNTVDSLPVPDAYISYYQAPRSGMMLFLRTARDPASVAAAARRAIHEVAPTYPAYDVQPMDARVAAATAQARFSAALLALFAGVALALAVVGIYGVMSFAVVQRTREIGIRMALGADRREVARFVIGEGVALVAAGAVIGLAAALMLTRILRSLLFDVTPSAPATYVAIVVVLGAAAAVASWVPARRAARVDPTEALRTG
jgi:predicted permease